MPNKYLNIHPIIKVNAEYMQISINPFNFSLSKYSIFFLTSKIYSIYSLNINALIA